MSRDRPWLLLVDFDGTLTLRDADFVIADALLGEARGRALYEPLARDFEALRIGTDEYFAGYLAGLGARLADLVLARDILLEHCRREGITCQSWESFGGARAALEAAQRGSVPA